MNGFQVKNKSTKVDECYGLYEYSVTLDDIAALLKGKKLYSTVSYGEYAITIQMVDDEDDNS